MTFIIPAPEARAVQIVVRMPEGQERRLYEVSLAQDGRVGRRA